MERGGNLADFTGNPRTTGIVNKLGGGLLIGAGVTTVAFAGGRN